MTLTINAVNGTPGLPRGTAWESLPWLSSTTAFGGGGTGSGPVQLKIPPGSGQVIGGVSASIPSVPVLASSDVVDAVGRDFQGIVAVRASSSTSSTWCAGSPPRRPASRSWSSPSRSC